MAQLPSGIAIWLGKKKFTIEIVLVSLVLLCGTFKFLFLPGADELLMISMVTLSAFYFLIAFAPGEESNAFVLILNKVFSISSAVCVIGLLFMVLHMPGAKEQLMIGLISLVLSGVIMLFLVISSQAQSGKLFPAIIRLVVLGALSLYGYLGLSERVIN